MLFTDRSVWTMVHGIVLGGVALMGLSAALFYLYAARVSDGPQASAPNASRALAALTVLTAVTLCSLRNMAGIFLAICFALVSFVSLMGVFVNKVAPLQ